MAATAEQCAYCFDVLIETLTKTNVAAVLPAASKDEKHAMFVTWHKYSSDEKDEQLRGCIGTFKPLGLVEGLKKFALSSALEDGRFSPIDKSEISRLSCDVSLLSNFEKRDDVYDWKIGQHGITIEFSDNNAQGELVKYSATYLPEVASSMGWSQEETLRQLVKKSGYTQSFNWSLKNRMKLTRYQSSKAGLTYAGYLVMRQKLANGAAINGATNGAAMNGASMNGHKMGH